MKSNNVHIEIDRNEDYTATVVNTDLMHDVAAAAFDWRLFAYDGENDWNEICDAIFKSLDEHRADIAFACHLPNPDDIIIRFDSLDASEFIWVIEYESAYEGTVSSYDSIVMIDYRVDDSTFSHD